MGYTPTAGKNRPSSTRFHFDSEHNEATGLSALLFPVQLNLPRANHKAKCLSHKTPFLRSARPGFYCSVGYKHTMVFFPIILLWNLSCSKPPKGGHHTLCFLSLPALTRLHFFQAVGNHLLMCLSVYMQKRSTCYRSLVRAAWVKWYLLELKHSTVFTELIL